MVAGRKPHLADYAIIKVAVLGEKGIGKTTFLKRFLNQPVTSTYVATQSEEILQYSLQKDDHSYIVAFFDRPGAMTYTLHPEKHFVYRSSLAALLFVDLTKDIQQRQLLNSIADFRLVCGAEGQINPPVVVVGTRSDLVDAPTLQMRRNALNDFCKTYGFKGPFITSANKANSIKEAMDVLLDKSLETHQFLYPDVLSEVDSDVEMDAKKASGEVAEVPKKNFFTPVLLFFKKHWRPIVAATFVLTVGLLLTLLTGGIVGGMAAATGVGYAAAYTINAVLAMSGGFLGGIAIGAAIGATVNKIKSVFANPPILPADKKADLVQGGTTRRVLGARQARARGRYPYPDSVASSAASTIRPARKIEDETPRDELGVATDATISPPSTDSANPPHHVASASTPLPAVDNAAGEGAAPIPPPPPLPEDRGDANNLTAERRLSQ